MINRNLLLALSFAGLSTNLYAQEPADYWQQFKKAKQLCEQNKFKDALAILEALEKSKADYNIELVLGDTYSAQGKLAQALYTYQLALEHGTAAKNSVIERVALFKIGRVQLALKNYPAAAAIYHRLLATKLDKEDDAVARQGYQTAHDNAVIELLEKARLLIDKNEGKQAYQLIKPHLVEENAFSFYIIAAQAKAIMNEPFDIGADF
ncbi:tetratricopeptide repeat protein [Legionella sp. km772]|uniref:tetratricopeptide repeat protein n=1 Tax=Legionella sp. km772 TaxID=2498111 RepID=UPI001315127E|nr:tetratricopeptide repeat protein [Legionella sp. km772]